MVYAVAEDDAAALCGPAPCCYASIQAAPASLNLPVTTWILGIPAMRNLYLAFDYSMQTVGIAARA